MTITIILNTEGDRFTIIGRQLIQRLQQMLAVIRLFADFNRSRNQMITGRIHGKTAGRRFWLCVDAVWTDCPFG